MLPGCSKQFPRDLGKERPCLNYHMNNCDGWCQLSRSQKDYHARMEQAVLILQGNYKQVAGELRAQMEAAADKLQFELAASLRDRLRAVESLGEKQLVTAGTMANTDVIGYYQNETRACFAVLHYVNGSLLDKEYEILSTADDPKEAVSSLVKQFYLVRGAAPKVILTPFEMEDAELFSALLQQELGKKVLIRMPQRGDNVRLVELAQKNAREEAERITTKAERHTGTLGVLADMLHLPDTPHRMESYDISNLAGTDIVASMVVFQDGKPLKSAYKRFKVEGLTDPDDYASMHQVLLRRLTHYVQQDAGFAERPDVLLIDGGIEHARVAEDVLQPLGLSIPPYGMVKAAAERASVPVALHLDHGDGYDRCMQAFRTGYTSVMIDGSHESFEDNIALTKSVADAGRAMGVPVEAELGKVGGKEDDGPAVEGESPYTDPAEAKEFVERTGCTSLAIGVGTSHGVYTSDPHIEQSVVKAIRAAVAVPLVLHGTSGVPDEQVAEAVKNGICKVNYATELRQAYTKGFMAYMAENPACFDPKKPAKEGMREITELVKIRMTNLNSVGKAE